MPKIMERSQSVFDMQWKEGANAGLTLCFDDGYKQTYELTRELLSSYGLRATYFVPTDRVGKRYHDLPVMSWKDLKECIDMGMEVGSHSITHREHATSITGKTWRFLKNLHAEEYKVAYMKYITGVVTKRSIETKCPDYGIESEIALSKQILERELSPYRVSSYAYPMGSFNDNSKRLVMKSGYSNARTTMVGLNDPERIDPYALKCSVWRHYTTPSMMNRWVDRALESGSWLIELFHLVTDSTDSGRESCSLDHLKSHLEYITDKHIWIDTQDSVAKSIERSVAARIAGRHPTSF
jgi:peptidoglycan/xylan/chitin deacetylase (PgdA/CDA1 family)